MKLQDRLKIMTSIAVLLEPFSKGDRDDVLTQLGAMLEDEPTDVAHTTKKRSARDRSRREKAAPKEKKPDGAARNMKPKGAAQMETLRFINGRSGVICKDLQMRFGLARNAAWWRAKCLLEKKWISGDVSGPYEVTAAGKKVLEEK